MITPQASGARCPVCDRSRLITDESIGETFCGQCGSVVNEKAEDMGAEWRSFSNEHENRSRTGAGTSITMHDMGLSTIIDSSNKDSTGKPLAAGVKRTIERLRTWDSRTQASTSTDRNLRQALNEMDKIKTKMGLTDAVIEKAAYIYRKAMEKNLIRGRSIQGLVAACLYAACRNTQTPRTLDDISKSINIRRKDVARCYRLIYRELDLQMPVVDPVKGVARIASEAHLTEPTKRRAIAILDLAKENGLVAGKDPMGIAAAALYIACIEMGDEKSQKEISNASGVTEVTIRNRCVGLRQMLNSTS